MCISRSPYAWGDGPPDRGPLHYAAFLVYSSWVVPFWFFSATKITTCTWPKILCTRDPQHKILPVRIWEYIYPLCKVPGTRGKFLEFRVSYECCQHLWPWFIECWRSVPYVTVDDFRMDSPTWRQVIGGAKPISIPISCRIRFSAAK